MDIEQLKLILDAVGGLGNNAALVAGIYVSFQFLPKLLWWGTGS